VYLDRRVNSAKVGRRFHTVLHRTERNRQRQNDGQGNSRLPSPAPGQEPTDACHQQRGRRCQGYAYCSFGTDQCRKPDRQQPGDPGDEGLLPPAGRGEGSHREVAHRTGNAKNERQREDSKGARTVTDEAIETTVNDTQARPYEKRPKFSHLRNPPDDLGLQRPASERKRGAGPPAMADWPARLVRSVAPCTGPSGPVTVERHLDGAAQQVAYAMAADGHQQIALPSDDVSWLKLLHPNA
jgi:hypothetical protein